MKPEQHGNQLGQCFGFPRSGEESVRGDGKRGPHGAKHGVVHAQLVVPIGGDHGRHGREAAQKSARDGLFDRRGGPRNGQPERQGRGRRGGSNAVQVVLRQTALGNVHAEEPLHAGNGRQHPAEGIGGGQAAQDLRQRLAPDVRSEIAAPDGNSSNKPGSRRTTRTTMTRRRIVGIRMLFRRTQIRNSGGKGSSRRPTQ